MKAQDALIAAGIINKIGSMPAPSAAAAKIGMRSTVVAILLVTSVRKVTARQIVAIIKSIGNVDKDSKPVPITLLSPELVNAVAMVMPAPNSSSIPHGIRSAVCQSSKRDDSPVSIALTIRNDE